MQTLTASSRAVKRPMSSPYFCLKNAYLSGLIATMLSSGSAFAVEQPTAATSSSVLIFNNNNLPSDLSGSLEATVSFAQSQIMPSINKIEGDVQPHLTAERSTLLMVKPKRSDLNVSTPLRVTATDSQGRNIGTLQLNPPNLLPKNAYAIMGAPDGNIDFAPIPGPSAVIDSIEDIAKLNDPSAAYLQSRLSAHNLVQINTADGFFTYDMYLPNAASMKDKVVKLSSEATYSSTIHYSGRQVMLTQGNTLTFKFLSGRWILEGEANNNDLVYPDADIDFTPLPGPSAIIDSVAAIAKLNDPSGAYLQSTLSTHNFVLIKTADGFFTREIYLPNAASMKDKVITVSSRAGYTSEIYYSGRHVSLTTGNSVTFKYVNGQWVLDGELINNNLEYAENTWSIKVPPHWIKPGVKMQFSHGELVGELIGVKVGATTELLLHTIDIGMLTEPRNAFRFAKETSTHREYFQTVPVSRMTVSQYESLHLSEVMLPNGTLLTDFDPSTGGWHEGAMREYIGKDLISLGIDNANYGINNSEGEAGHPYIASQLTAHNSRGNYQNGVVTHGGSGGSGIVTLDNSLGNEFSHEVGHNFGIGHFPGGFKGSIHSPATAINSTWGWDADLNKFIPNFARSITNQSACLDGECQAPFAGRRFGSDSLAGGEPMSKVNHFTLYTPYTAAHIQQNLESKVVFAADSSTGFKKWDPATQTMKAYEHRVMNGNQVNAAIYKLSEAYLTDLIKDYDLVTVSMSDGNWTMYIDVPAASEANRGRTITIRHNAGYHSHLRMNGVSELMYRGLVKSYISDGNTWNESEAPDLTIAKVPESFGIPVTTLVGYYDPQGLLPSYIYPALHGAYGFTYSDDKDRLTAKDCHLEVNTHQGKRFNFKLASVRVNGTNMNKFHVNIPETSQPESAAVICGVNTLVTKAIEPAKETLSYTVNGYDQNTTYHKWGDFEQIGNVGDLYIYDNPYNGDKELFKLVYVGSDGRYGFFPTDKNNNYNWTYISDIK